MILVVDVAVSMGLGSIKLRKRTEKDGQRMIKINGALTVSTNAMVPPRPSTITGDFKNISHRFD